MRKTSPFIASSSDFFSDPVSFIAPFLMEDITYDVLISGAGPAGTSCALSLKNSGLQVGLIDKATFPRDKICGDALSPDVINQLRLLSEREEGLTLPFSQATRKTGMHGITFVSPAGHRLEVPVKVPHKAGDVLSAPGYVMARQHFDNFLLRQVKEQTEIEVKEGTEALEAGQTADGFAITTNRGVIHTRFLVLADGAQSRLARSVAGMKVEHDHYCAGIRQYWEGVTFPATRPFIELHFLHDVLPGYFWIFPMPNGRANVGLGMLSAAVRKNKVNLRQLLDHIIKEHPGVAHRFSRARALETPKGWGLPVGSKKRPLSGYRYVVCGDAASLIDPFTGEGIGNAIRSGRVAADTIRQTFDTQQFGAAALKSYDKEIYRRMGKELALSRRMQQMLRFPFLFDLVVKKAARNPALRSLITAMLTDMDIKKELIKPSFYGKLLLGAPFRK
ncbi:geranylgeranyl reductase family protein [Roseivirga sp. BDSF3-8]|uniref:geranylgeranyl reductase family protein n=1 Tax=Roseivirga sp. BDSF3-8 TaxID=3241598 RepID=UPI0035323D62